jgi:hypothetical protein
VCSAGSKHREEFVIEAADDGGTSAFHYTDRRGPARRSIVMRTADAGHHAKNIFILIFRRYRPTISSCGLDLNRIRLGSVLERLTSEFIVSALVKICLATVDSGDIFTRSTLRSVTCRHRVRAVIQVAVETAAERNIDSMRVRGFPEPSHDH